MMQRKEGTYSLPAFLEFLFLFISADSIAAFYVISAYFASLMGVDYGHYLLTSWDVAIPFTLIFFPFYVSEYFVLGFLIIITAVVLKFNTAFSRQLFCGAMLIELGSTVIFLLFPASFLPLLAAAGEPQGAFFNHLFAGFNSTVLPPFNSLPSLHIASGWFCIRLAQHFFPAGKLKKGVLIAANIWFAGMLLSTLTLKYHYLLDVLTGFAVAELVYWLVIKKDIFEVEKWNQYLNHGAILVIEAIVMLLTLLILYVSYPQYMQLGR